MVEGTTSSVAIAGHGEMRGRLICFTAAACIDRYICVPELGVGRINRPSSVTAQAGGKGVNVARTARALGADVRLVGHASKPIRDEVADEGIPVTWSSSSRTRECISILDRSSGELTEIYEPLPPEPVEAWPLLRETYRRTLAESGPDDVLTISGRLPDEFPVSALTALVTEARSAGLRTWLDTDDRGLADCLRGRPDLVKINHREAAELTGAAITDPDTAVAAARALCERGTEAAIITLGDRGCVYVDQAGNACHQPAPALEHAVAVGSGDAFLAGLGVAALRGLPRAHALQLATATASATAQHLVTGYVTSDEVENVLREIPPATELPTTTVRDVVPPARGPIRGSGRLP